MHFEIYDIESPYDEIQIQVFEELINILNKIDTNLKNKNFILSGGYLIHNFIKFNEPYDFKNDIDFFFETPSDFFEFDFILNEFITYNLNQQPPYTTENAKTYHLKLQDDFEITIQLIKTYFGNSEQILKNFDLQNCQIALNQKGILTVNSLFEKLYNQKKILINENRVKDNLNKLGKDYLFVFAKRILKYINKYKLWLIENYDLITQIETEYFEVLNSNFETTFIFLDSSGDCVQNSESIEFFWSSMTFKSYNHYKNFKQVESDWYYSHLINKKQPVPFF